MSVGWYPYTSRASITATALLAVIFAFAPFIAVPAADAQVCPPEKSAAECASGGLTNTAEQSGLKSRGGEARPLTKVIGTLINVALSLTGIIFIILMIYGGFLWMQARGSSEDVEKAKEIIKNAVIGIIVLALAFAITNFIFAQLVTIAG